MSEDWLELVRFAERECHKRGLMFKMQNCPGWSMSADRGYPQNVRCAR